MNCRFLFMILLITVGALPASAQQQESVKTRSQLTPFGKIAPVKLPVRSMADTTSPKRALANDIYIKKWYHDGVLLNANSMGKVYSMPVDNMACLVSDNTRISRMPVKKTKVPEQMPNAFSRRNRF